MKNNTITSPKGFTAAGVRCGIKGSGKLDLGLIVCGKNRQRDDRFRNMHGCHGPIQTRRDKRIPGSTVDAEQGSDIAGRNSFNVFHLIRMHADNATDLHLFT